MLVRKSLESHRFPIFSDIDHDIFVQKLTKNRFFCDFLIIFETLFCSSISSWHFYKFASPFDLDLVEGSNFNVQPKNISFFHSSDYFCRPEFRGQVTDLFRVTKQIAYSWPYWTFELKALSKEQIFCKNV